VTIDARCGMRDAGFTMSDEGCGTILATTVRSRRLAQATFVIALSACLGAGAAAQQPDQVPKPSFSSSVDIVSVDVNVVDRNGEPARSGAR
jgi:hypothetical protein